MLEGLSFKLRYTKYDGERYLNRSKTLCISGEKNKSIGQRFRDYQFRSPSIPLTTPINQLTALKKKRKKRKKGEQKLVSPRQKSHPGLRSAIDYRFTGRWASRHSSKSRWIDRAIERSANGLPPRKILRLSRWSAFAARKRGNRCCCPDYSRITTHAGWHRSTRSKRHVGNLFSRLLFTVLAVYRPDLSIGSIDSAAVGRQTTRNSCQPRGERDELCVEKNR